MAVWQRREDLLAARASAGLLAQPVPPFLPGGSTEAPQTPLIGSEGPDAALIGSAVGRATGEPAGTGHDQHRAAVASSHGSQPRAARAWPVTPDVWRWTPSPVLWQHSSSRCNVLPTKQCRRKSVSCTAIAWSRHRHRGWWRALPWLRCRVENSVSCELEIPGERHRFLF